MKKSSLIWLLLSLITTNHALAASTSKGIMGAVENILLPQGFMVEARLDTGALSASMNASNIKISEKNGQKWVKFESFDKKTKRLFHYEYPLEGTVSIRSRRPNGQTEAPKFEQRPVIMLPICLGDQKKTIRVNLIDRSHFTYPFLLGREAMDQFDIIIDPSLKLTKKPNCKKESSS